MQLRGDHGVLARSTAGPDGVVGSGCSLPPAASGATSLDVVGATSEVTAARLQVAARVSEPGRGPTSWPALLALLSLVGAAGGLVSALRRRRRSATRRPRSS